MKGDETALKRTCNLSGDWAARFAVKKHLAIYDKDRKEHFDKSQPRITRTIEGMAPAELVYGDVHPADFTFIAEDGTDIRVRVIAWQDHATRRMLAYPVFFTSGRGVRQGDIVESFIALTQDALWGMPKTLYLDNGGEYNCLDAISDAMAVSGWPEKARPIVKAMPYNGPAKGSIESAFRTLELHFAAIPGWIGGDRMKKKTHSVGRPAIPFSGTASEMRDRILEAVEIFNAAPQTKHGALKGRSPDAAFEEARNAGWRRNDIDPAALDAVFSKRESRTIRSGGITIGNVRYACDAFAEMFGGENVALRIPMRTGVEGVLVYDDRDRFLGVAHPDTAYHPLDVEGAKEGGRRQKLQRGRIKREREDVAVIDPHKVALETARTVPAPLGPERGGRIMLTDDMANQARALNAPTADVATIRERERRDERAEIEKRQEREFAKYRAARARLEAAEKRNREGSNPHDSIT